MALYSPPATAPGMAIRDRGAGAFDLNYALPGWISTSSASALFGAVATPPVVAEINFTPIVVTETSVFDQIGVRVTTLFAGGVARVGVYSADASTHAPSALLNDYGTVSTTTTGDKLITISLALQPGIYWLATCADNTTCRFLGVNTTAVTPPVTYLGFATNGAAPYVVATKASAGTPAVSGLPSPAGTTTYPGTGWGAAWAFLRYDRTV